jgi:hypothetical protein
MAQAEARMELRGPHEVTDETIQEPYSHSYIVGFRSALVDYYTNGRMTICKETDDDLKAM